MTKKKSCIKHIDGKKLMAILEKSLEGEIEKSNAYYRNNILLLARDYNVIADAILCIDAGDGKNAKMLLNEILQDFVKYYLEDQETIELLKGNPLMFSLNALKSKIGKIKTMT
jgi:hypothetical protein